MWDLIVSVLDHCLSFYFLRVLNSHLCLLSVRFLLSDEQTLLPNFCPAPLGPMRLNYWLYSGVYMYNYLRVL